MEAQEKFTHAHKKCVKEALTKLKILARVNRIKC